MRLHLLTLATAIIAIAPVATSTTAAAAALVARHRLRLPEPGGLRHSHRLRCRRHPRHRHSRCASVPSAASARGAPRLAVAVTVTPATTAAATALLAILAAFRLSRSGVGVFGLVFLGGLPRFPRPSRCLRGGRHARSGHCAGRVSSRCGSAAVRGGFALDPLRDHARLHGFATFDHEMLARRKRGLGHNRDGDTEAVFPARARLSRFWLRM